MADVAVVLVTVNSKADVERNLRELRDQTGVSLELVAVDNGSTDGTVELLAAQPDVRLISNGENRWLAPAWNQGIAASEAPFVLFLTPDTSLRGVDTIVRLEAALEADPGAALAGPRLVDEAGTDLLNGSYAFPSVRWILLKAIGLAGVFGKDVKPPPLVTRPETVGVDIVNGACMLARRDALEAVGGLDDRFRLYLEEVDLCRRLRAAGYRVLVAGDAQVVHRGKGSPTPPGFRERAGRHSEWVYVRKHHGLVPALAVRAARAFERLRMRLGGARRAR